MIGQYAPLSSIKAWLFHQRIRQLSTVDQATWYDDLERRHPHLFRPGDQSIEDEHRSLWAGLRRWFSPLTLRLSGNLSGVWDPRIVPLDTYTSEIEGTLDPEPTSAFLAHKSLYDRLFSNGEFPESYLHNVDGLFFDREYRLRRPDEVESIMSGCSYPVVVKPSYHTKGGHDVAFPDSCNSLKQHIANRRNFVVQARIRQNPFFARFNAFGLNTLRCCVYRSVKDETFHVLSVALRMGRTGKLDNLSQGGLVCAIGDDGRFHSFAVDDYGNKYTEHPDSHLRFDEVGELPKYQELLGFVRTTAAQLWYHRLVSFDVASDEDGRWRLIEVNLRGQTISFSQFAGLPFFGRFTDEVIEYCTARRPWKVP